MDMFVLSANAAPKRLGTNLSKINRLLEQEIGVASEDLAYSNNILDVF